MKKMMAFPPTIFRIQKRKVWWKCGKGHEWQAEVSKRYRGGNCPYCSGKKVCYENSLAFLHPKLSKAMWNYEKNGLLTPADVTVGSGKKVWWKCEKGHEWLMRVCDLNKGCRCPYCSNHRVSSLNALAIRQPKLAYEWNYDKNGDLTPLTISVSSGKNVSSIKVWWKCAKGHSWQALIRSRTVIGSGCPVCAGKAASPDYNLVTEYPDIALDWDMHKNKLPPEQYLPYSNKTVWWKCHTCGSSWKAMVIKRTREKKCCPQCSI